MHWKEAIYMMYGLLFFVSPVPEVCEDRAEVSMELEGCSPRSDVPWIPISSRIYERVSYVNMSTVQTWYNTGIKSAL